MSRLGLTADQVANIRLSNLSDQYWADALGVNRSSVKRARVGMTHCDVPVPPQPNCRRPRFDTGAKRDGQPTTVDLDPISLPGEEWRPVVGWERFYRVSNLGRLYSLHQTGRLVTGMRVGDGYGVLKLRDGQRRGHKATHCMVLEAFVGPRPSPEYEGCHNDGDPENCRLGNLRWDTAKANQADRIAHGTDCRGEKAAVAKLTDAVVRQIRLTPDISASEWAKKLGVDKGTVKCARNGTTWKHLDIPPVRLRS